MIEKIHERVVDNPHRVLQLALLALGGPGRMSLEEQESLEKECREERVFGESWLSGEKDLVTVLLRKVLVDSSLGDLSFICRRGTRGLHYGDRSGREVWRSSQIFRSCIQPQLKSSLL